MYISALRFARLAAAGILIVGPVLARAATADTVTATLCVNPVNGALRVADEGTTCRDPEQKVDWTVGGQITHIDAGDGLVVEPVQGGVAIRIDRNIVQVRPTQACGDGSDGSAIASIEPDGSVLCTAPHGLVTTFDAGDVAALGRLNVSACDDPDYSGTIGALVHSQAGPFTLPPGIYLPVFGNSNEILGHPFQWRISKAAGRGNPNLFYDGTVRALIQARDALGGPPRTVSAFQRYFHSDGGGYPDATNQDHNPTNQDFGLIVAQFPADYYLYIEASTHACGWAQVGGQVAILRIQ